MILWAIQLVINIISVYIHSLYVNTHCLKLSQELNHCRKRYILRKAKNTPVYNPKYYTYCYTKNYK